MVETRKYNFKQDVVSGESGEDEVVAYMESLGMKFIGKSMKESSYDIVMQHGDRVITYEVKTDIYPVDTGRMVIEFESRGKPSGISVTNADYFCYYYKNLGEIWNIKTSTLRSIVELFYDSMAILDNIGDVGSNTRGYVLERRRFKKSFRVHKI